MPDASSTPPSHPHPHPGLPRSAAWASTPTWPCAPAPKRCACAGQQGGCKGRGLGLGLWVQQGEWEGGPGGSPGGCRLSGVWASTLSCAFAHFPPLPPLPRLQHRAASPALCRSTRQSAHTVCTTPRWVQGLVAITQRASGKGKRRRGLSYPRPLTTEHSYLPPILAQGALKKLSTKRPELGGRSLLERAMRPSVNGGRATYGEGVMAGGQGVCSGEQGGGGTFGTACHALLSTHACLVEQGVSPLAH